MAVIDDNVHSDESTRFAELKTIDINDSSIPEGKEVDINPNADAWEQACPPPDGIYKLKLFESRNAYQMGKNDDGEIYYIANLECKIQADNKDLHDRTVFAKVQTYIPQGKEISTMAGLIRKMGPNVPAKITPRQQIQLFRRVLSKEPNLYAQGEWACWDMPKGEWLKRGMKNFPKLEDGKSYYHVVRDSKGNQVVAKWKVLKWFGLKEYREILEKEEARKRQTIDTRVTEGIKKNEEIGNFQEVVGIISNPTAPNIIVSEEDFVIEE